MAGSQLQQDRHDATVLETEAGTRLDAFLAARFPLFSRNRIKDLILLGAVSVDGTTNDVPKYRVRTGESITLAAPEPVEAEPQPQDIALNILFEDQYLIVIDKPAGMVVHPAPGSPSGTLVNALLAHCGDDLSGVGGMKRPGIVHRIDKDTSGLLVVAKTDRAHHGLAAQFEKHTVERQYVAVVYGVPDANDPRLRGTPGVSFEPGNILKITTQLARHKTDRQRQAVLFQGGRHAVTRARIVESYGTPPVLSLVECWLETGRTHQIRVHMAHAGHALVGDPTYGGRRKLARGAVSEAADALVRDFPRQALHAQVLGFIHPASGESLRFEAKIPQDMVDLIGALQS